MTDRSPAEIQHDIQRTRARMSVDIDALENKLSPDRLKARARAQMRRAQDAAIDKAREVAGQGARAARRAGREAVTQMKEHPQPTAIAGGALLGLALLGRAFSSRRNEDEEAAMEDERERFREWREQTRNAGKQAGRAAGRIARRAGRGARHLADEAIDTGGAWREEAESWTQRAGHRLGALAEKARSRIQPRRRRGIRRYLPESPWAIGAVCAVVGAAAVGLAVSRTSAGRRLARRRDDLAEDLAEDLGNELSDDFDEISSSARVMARNAVEHEPEELA